MLPICLKKLFKPPAPPICFRRCGETIFCIWETPALPKERKSLEHKIRLPGLIPFIPDTTFSNCLCCANNSLTSLTDRPDPRATLSIRPWLSTLGKSNSEKKFSLNEQVRRTLICHTVHYCHVVLDLLMSSFSASAFKKITQTSVGKHIKNLSRVSKVRIGKAYLIQWTHL